MKRVRKENQPQNLVWIQLEPKSDSVEDKREAAVAGTRLLQKCGVTDGAKFDYWEDTDLFHYVAADGSCWELPENGHWLNLDYLGAAQ